jgi:hypothetical protein
MTLRIGGDNLARVLETGDAKDAAMLLASLRPAAALGCCASLTPRRLAAVVVELPDHAFDSLCLIMVGAVQGCVWSYKHLLLSDLAWKQNELLT